MIQIARVVAMAFVIFIAADMAQAKMVMRTFAVLAGARA